ncbi:MAG: HD domain-containing protein [Propionicimonas sp.]
MKDTLATSMSSIVEQPSSAPGLSRLSRVAVEAVSIELLAYVGTRLAHVRTAGRLARSLSRLFEPDEAELLVAAATLHDIGYAPRIARTGFHPLDGAVFLRAEGFPDRLASLVAHHSHAVMTAEHHGVCDLAEQFPREDSLLSDALVFADMHSAPDGSIIPAERRLADIVGRHTHPAVQARDRSLRTSIARIECALTEASPRAVTLPGPAGR